jgi:hypothetical protein
MQHMRLRGVWVFCAAIFMASTGCSTNKANQSDDEPNDTGSFSTSEPYDCAKALPTPGAETIIEGASGYKGLTFDNEGHIVGNDGNSLIKATYDGEKTVWIPGVGEMEGIAYLSGGDLITTYGYSPGELKRYSPEGGETVLVGGLENYSVVIAPNDLIFGAGWNGAFMVDPNTGEYTKFLSDGSPDFPRGVSPRTLAFSRDHRTLYIGTIDNRGRIYTLALDDDYTPIGSPELFAEGVGHGWHDGLDLDVCGNVYAVDYDSSALYRASADGGTVDKLADWSSNSREFAHGLIFGSGEGGWRVDALYLPEPENGKQVKEIVLGVPGSKWDGEVLNAP